MAHGPTERHENRISDAGQSAAQHNNLRIQQAHNVSHAEAEIRSYLVQHLTRCWVATPRCCGYDLGSDLCAIPLRQEAN